MWLLAKCGGGQWAIYKYKLNGPFAAEHRPKFLAPGAHLDDVLPSEHWEHWLSDSELKIRRPQLQEAVADLILSPGRIVSSGTLNTVLGGKE